MNYIRTKKQRLTISVLAAGLAVLLTASAPDTLKAPSYLAWWGTLYPQFCFSKIPELSAEERAGRESSDRHVKISFWLAKALDW